MDENALEAMLARQRNAERGYRPQGSVRTEKTDEFEVYERKDAAQEPAPSPPSPAQAPPPSRAPGPTAPSRHAPLRAPAGRSAGSDFEELPGRQPEPPASQVPQAAPEAHTAAPVQAPQAVPEPVQAPQAVPEPVQAPQAAPSPQYQPAAPSWQTPQPPAPEASRPAPETLPETRRPQVWPPIQPKAPESAAEAAPARTHAPEPAAPQGASNGSGCRIAIVQALFNPEITQQMADAATAHAERAGAEVRHHVHVPGVFDLPLTTQTLARRKDVDAVVVIGCVIQGETDHDDLITFTTAKTLQEISLATETPVGLGIIGPGMTWEQAQERVGNGAHAVEAVIAQWRALQAV